MIVRLQQEFKLGEDNSVPIKVHPELNSISSLQKHLILDPMSHSSAGLLRLGSLWSTMQAMSGCAYSNYQAGTNSNIQRPLKSRQK